MNRAKKQLTFTLALLAALAAAGCAGNASIEGSFDRSLTVDGPVRLELGNVAGSVQVLPGPPGRVEIHGSFRVHAWSWRSVRTRVAELESNPPIEQSQNLIRVGTGLRPLARHSPHSLIIHYSITTPPDTEVHVDLGAGEIRVEGVRGPVQLTTGSGAVTAEQIGGDARVRSASGDIALREIKGEADATSGGGNMRLADISGDVRARSGAGNITVENPQQTVNVKSGAGNIRITGASDDIRAHDGMGNVTIEGNPRAASYWEVHSGMGNLALRVPPTASFHLYARTGMGGIRSELPGLPTEHSRHELRAHVGSGGGRIEIESGMGEIRIQPASLPPTGSH